MLAAAGETAESRERHARFFLGPDNVPTPFAPVFDAPESSVLLAAERDNVRLAFMWLDERGEMDALLGRIMLLYRLWFAPGLHREGQYWIERALERTCDAAPLVRFRALDAAMTMAQHGGDHARAALFAAEGLALAREFGDPHLVGEALANFGLVAYRQGDYGRAEELLLEAHDLLRDQVERSPDGTTLLILGDTALAQEQFARAAAWYAEALEHFEATRYPWGLSDARAGLGGVYFCLGDLAQAATLYGDSLKRAQDQGLMMLVISSLFGLMAIAGASGQPETGAHLLGAAEGLAESLGAPIYPRDRPVRDRALAALSATLGDQRLADARAAGRALTVEEAISEAQAVAEAVTPMTRLN
jgi:non-specific serine/threonine protein kinase